MATQQDDGPFRLDSLPGELWGMARMVQELRADDQTVRRWVREGCLPGPALRRNGRAYWDPADVDSFLRKRLHRIGAET
jgi:hypothetical protein